MWASQRAVSNFTEIKNLLVNAPYTVRVSVSTHLSLLGSPRARELRAHFYEILTTHLLDPQPLALGRHHLVSPLNQCHGELEIRLPLGSRELMVMQLCLLLTQIFC